MYGEGLLRLIDDNLNFYSFVNTVGSNNIYSVSSDSNNIWFSSDNSITMISMEGALFRNSYRFPMSLTGAKPNTIFCSEGGLIYLGFEKEGVFTFNPGSEEFKKIFISRDDLENSVNHITGKGNTIWISTKKGICKLNPLTGEKKWFNTNSGLPYNNIQQLFY